MKMDKKTISLLPALKTLIDEGRLRYLRYYSRKKGVVVRNDVLCCDETVDTLFRKFKRQGKLPREIGRKYAGLCDSCQYTSCWDFGKAVRCAEFKKAN